MNTFKLLSNTSSNYLQLLIFPVSVLVATTVTSMLKEIWLLCVILPKHFTDSSRFIITVHPYHLCICSFTLWYDLTCVMYTYI